MAISDRDFNTKLAAVGLSLVTAGACGTVTWVANNLILSDAIPTGASIEAVTKIFEQGRIYFIPAGFLASGLFFRLAHKSPRAFTQSPYAWAGILHSVPIFFTFIVMMKPCIGLLSSAHHTAGAEGSVVKLGGEVEARRLIKLFGSLNAVRAAVFGVSGLLGLKAVMDGE